MFYRNDPVWEVEKTPLQKRFNGTFPNAFDCNGKPPIRSLSTSELQIHDCKSTSKRICIRDFCLLTKAANQWKIDYPDFALARLT